MTSYRFFKMAAMIEPEMYFGVQNNSDGICLSRWKSICIPNFDEILNPRLRYNYFRFRKTDGLNIGILFPVSSLIYV